MALVTPMKPNGDVDYPSLGKLIDWHLESDTDGLVVLGTTGEASTIEPEERSKIISHTVDQVKGRIPVIIGTGANSTRHAIALTQQAMELGADAALLVTPYYNKPTQEGLFQHYSAVANAVPLPQILYNIPSRTGCDLLPQTVLRLSKIVNVVGIKEGTGDITRVKQIKAGCEDDFDLLSGDDKTAMEFMLAGGVGVISVVANIMPKEFHLFCAATIANKIDLAKQYNNKMSALYSALFVESNPIPTKWVLEKMGKIPGGIRLPLTPLSSTCYGDVKNALRNTGIQI